MLRWRPSAWLIAWGLLSGLAFGQTGASGQLIVTVVDPGGGILPGVEVSALHNDLSFRTTTGATGRAVLNIPAATYNVQVKLGGFVTVRRQSVEVSAGRDSAIQVTLKLDTSKPAMTIIACPIPFFELDPQTTVVGRVRLNGLPIRRNLASIASLAPAVSVGH